LKFSEEFENAQLDVDLEVPEIEGAESLSASDLEALKTRLQSGSDFKNAIDSIKFVTNDVLNQTRIQAIENTQIASFGITSFSVLFFGFFIFL